MKLEVIAGKEISIGKKVPRTEMSGMRKEALPPATCLFSVGIDLAVKNLSSQLAVTLAAASAR